MDKARDVSSKMSASLKGVELLELKYGSLSLVHQKQLLLQSIQPTSHLQDLIRMHDATRLAFTNPFEEMLRHLRPSIDQMRLRLDLGHQMRDIIGTYRHEFTELSCLNDGLQEFQRHCSTSLAGIMDSQRIIREMGQHLHERIGDALIRSVVFPHERVANVLAGIRTLAEARERFRPAVDMALQAAAGYQKFATRQLQKTLVDTDTVRERRLIVTDLAGDLLETSQSAWEMVGTHVQGLDSEDVEQPALRLNVYRALNRQLAYLYRRDTSEDPYVAFDHSFAANISTVAGEIVELIYNINEYESGTTGENIFKPTNKSFRACIVLSNTIASTSALFAEVVDSLYLLLYEGSGQAQRLTNHLTDEELRTLWWIKVLRTSFRHDVDHGKESRSKYKLQEIGDVYRQLVGKARPTAGVDWSNAQISLYEHVAGLLRDVMDKLIASEH